MRVLLAGAGKVAGQPRCVSHGGSAAFNVARLEGGCSSARAVSVSANERAGGVAAPPQELEPPREVIQPDFQKEAAVEGDPERADFFTEASLSFLREELPRIFTTGVRLNSCCSMPVDAFK